MTELTDLRRAGAELRAAALALNAAHETETSPLSADRLDALLAEAVAAPALPDGSAFVLAFDEAADYDSVNYRWFRDRHPRFVYVDRIIVAPAQRGRGVARRLYAAVFEAARDSGRDLVACEVNAEPPNPVSDAVHAALGFRVAGQGASAPGKRVRYMLRDLS